MAKDGKTKKAESPLFIFLAVGDAEEIILKILIQKYLRGIHYKIFNAGQHNNPVQSVLMHSEPPFVEKKDILRIIYCVDNEQPYPNEGPHDVDIEACRTACIEENTHNVLSVDDIVANKMIESWFFYDLDGIYNYLKVKPKDREPLVKYKTPNRCSKGDLILLFRKYNNCYHEGKRAKDFYESLNWDLIIKSCPELNAGIKLIKRKANDLTSELFPHRSKDK